MSDTIQSVKCENIRGCPFLTYFHSRKKIEEAMDYMPKDNDVIIASYPKTGSTWMQYIVLQIASKGTVFPGITDKDEKVCPHLETVGPKAVDALTGFRSYRCHIPYNLVRKNEKAKYIYTYRHPEDTFTSRWYFILNHGFKSDLNEYIDCFLCGSVGYGSYFKHVLAIYEHRKSPNILMVSYEKLLNDTRNEVLRVAKFVGEEHHAYLVKHENVLDEILEHTSFDYMKKNLTYYNWFDFEKDKKVEVNLFRRGKVGDGKSFLTEEPRERFKEAARILQGTPIYKEWYPDENSNHGKLNNHE